VYLSRSVPPQSAAAAATALASSTYKQVAIATITTATMFLSSYTCAALVVDVHCLLYCNHVISLSDSQQLAGGEKGQALVLHFFFTNDNSFKIFSFLLYFFVLLLLLLLFPCL